MSSRGTANVLTRTTAILAAAFFATSLVLSILAGMDRNPDLDPRPGTRLRPADARHPARPRRGRAAASCDTLREQEQQPSGPQVPRSQ